MNAESVSRQLADLRKNSAIAAGTLICSDDVQDIGLPAENSISFTTDFNPSLILVCNRTTAGQPVTYAAPVRFEVGNLHA